MLAFAGRSNVGKSSLINALTNRNGLARTSSTPGRTQELIFFAAEGPVTLVDMPGYGYAAAPKAKVAAWTDLIHAYLKGRANLLRVYVLVDARRGLGPADDPVLTSLDETAVSYQVVLTKCDAVKPQALVECEAAARAALAKHPAAFPEVLATAADTGAGIPELRAAIARLVAERRGVSAGIRPPTSPHVAGRQGPRVGAVDRKLAGDPIGERPQPGIEAGRCRSRPGVGSVEVRIERRAGEREAGARGQEIARCFEPARLEDGAIALVRGGEAEKREGRGLFHSRQRRRHREAIDPADAACGRSAMSDGRLRTGDLVGRQATRARQAIFDDLLQGVVGRLGIADIGRRSAVDEGARIEAGTIVHRLAAAIAGRAAGENRRERGDGIGVRRAAAEHRCLRGREPRFLREHRDVPLTESEMAEKVDEHVLAAARKDAH